MLVKIQAQDNQVRNIVFDVMKLLMKVM